METFPVRYLKFFWTGKRNATRIRFKSLIRIKNSGIEFTHSVISISEIYFERKSETLISIRWKYFWEFYDFIKNTQRKENGGRSNTSSFSLWIWKSLTNAYSAVDVSRDAPYKSRKINFEGYIKNWCKTDRIRWDHLVMDQVQCWSHYSLTCTPYLR